MAKLDAIFFLCLIFNMNLFLNNEKELSELLIFLQEKIGIDFSRFRKSTLVRKISKRLKELELVNYLSYKSYIQENPEEIKSFVSLITVPYTMFFRDPIVFEYLRTYIIPYLLEKKKNIRIWCPGCATGEEAYSYAIILKEVMEKEEFFTNPIIIGTDIDKSSLSFARAGKYSSKDALFEVKKGYLDKYFIKIDEDFQIKEEIKEMVSFYHHDISTLTTPHEMIFSDCAIISIRNLLIYYEREFQKEILSFLIKLLPEDGFLVLGETEILPEEVDRYFEQMTFLKIYRKRLYD